MSKAVPDVRGVRRERAQRVAVVMRPSPRRGSIDATTRAHGASAALRRTRAMHGRFAVLALVALLSTACQPQHGGAMPADNAAAAVEDPTPSASPDAQAPAAGRADADAGSAEAGSVPASTTPVALQPRLDGFGPLRLGMTTREAMDAWPGLYADRPQRVSARDCDYAQVPDGALPYFALMFDGGRFVRYGGTTEDIDAPGGGKRGMTVDALQALYRSGLSQVPDPERPRGDGHRLVTDTLGTVSTRLAFVIERGRVLEWYVGTLQGSTDHTIGCPH